MKLYNSPIDPNSSVPLRDQIKAILEQEIQAGRWKVGEQLPTARELSLLTGISASTATQAVSLLFEEGYLERHVGRGSFLRAIRSTPKRRSGVIGVAIRGESLGEDAYPPSNRDYFRKLAEQAFLEMAEWDYAPRVIQDPSPQIPDPEDSFGGSISASEFEDIDGILSLRSPSEAVMQASREKHIPVVCLASAEAPFGVPYVKIDDRLEMWDAVDYLHEAGHRKIGFVHSIPNFTFRRLRGRLSAFLDACLQLGSTPKPEWILYAGEQDDLQLNLIGDFFALEDRPTAVICSNEAVAKGVYDVALILKHRIPEELSVVCCTPNLDYGNRLRPPLSTLVADTAAMAQLAVKLLVEMIKTEQPPTAGGFLIRSVLQKRESVYRIDDGSAAEMPTQSREEAILSGR